MMNTRAIEKKLLWIVLLFVILAQLLYTVYNIRMFHTEFSRQTDDQVRKLGEIIENKIALALKYNIPLESLGRVNLLLSNILEDTPVLSSIDIVKDGKILYTASKEGETLRVIEVPVKDPKSGIVAAVRLGIHSTTRNQTGRFLFDLLTIVMVGSVIAYELLLFFSSWMVAVPSRETVRAAGCIASNLGPVDHGINSREYSSFLNEMAWVAVGAAKRLDAVKSDLERLKAEVFGTARQGKEKILGLIGRQHRIISRTLSGTKSFLPLVTPAHVRPVIFVFVLSANLHSSFLPLYAQELLAGPTFLSGLLHEKILMGLPFTGYMITVTACMILLNSRQLKKIRPFRVMSAVFPTTVLGLALCGLAENIVTLILARMLCAVGFAVIVIYGRQYIVDHSTESERAYQLAGYTAAFSGGLFCSIIIGGILADYFSYRIVFFTAAAVMMFVLFFSYIVFSDQPAPSGVEPSGHSGIGDFLRGCVRDRNVVAVMLQGVVTRIMLIGFYYYALPIFLRGEFTYSDIGRIMMFYGLTNITLASYLNRFVRTAVHSKRAVVCSNLLLGVVLFSFYHIDFSRPAEYVLAGVAGLVILGVSNSLSFPSQVNLLLHTETVSKLGSRTPMIVYQSVERIGSALGPLVFGFFASRFEIGSAIGLGGLMCIGGNLIFLFLYRVPMGSEKDNG